jgi:hypothetical protein
VLHLGDQGVARALERLVAVGQGDLEEHAVRGHEVDLHADPAVGVVEPVGPDQLDAGGGLGTPRLSGRPLGDELGLGGGDGRSVV